MKLDQTTIVDKTWREQEREQWENPIKGEIRRVYRVVVHEPSYIRVMCETPNTLDAMEVLEGLRLLYKKRKIKRNVQVILHTFRDLTQVGTEPLEW